MINEIGYKGLSWTETLIHLKGIEVNQKFLMNL